MNQEGGEESIEEEGGTISAGGRFDGWDQVWFSSAFGGAEEGDDTKTWPCFKK